MEPLLFLAHRIPYPPNKGDKIRSFHVLQHLARRYRVYLGAFVDDPADWAYARALEQFCAETCLVPLAPFRSRLRSVVALLRREPLTLAYYRNERLQGWVNRLLAEGRVERAFVYCTAMAQYLERAPGVRKVLDLVDMDSDKWAQYAGARPWPLSWLYRRESEHLFAYERRAVQVFDAGLFVSAAEARLFRERAPETAARVSHVDNGVDLDYFAPGGAYPNPYGPGEKPLVFTGAMDYWANVEAVSWFADEVYPRVAAQQPAARFYVVGARPTAAVLGLARRPGVVVTGTVPDVRPYLAHARVAVAPLRIARGVQNKVLEAMAMAVPVVATPPAMDGIRLCDGLKALVADGAEQTAERVLERLLDNHDVLGLRERACVERHYRWDANLLPLEQLLETPATACGRSADEAGVAPAQAISLG